MNKARIEWGGEILAKDGYGILTREFLYPIKQDVKLIAEEDYVPPEKKYSSGIWLEELVNSYLKSDAPIRVSFSIPNLYKKIDGKTNIGLSMWDTNMYPIQWSQNMSKMDALIFPSKSMMEAYKRTGNNNPCASFKPHINTDRWASTGPITEVTSTENSVKYIAEGSYDARSNFTDLITGFVVAFEGVRDVSLIIKVESENVDEQRQIRGKVHELINFLKPRIRPNIMIMFDKLNEEQNAALFRGCHYYINTSTCMALPLGSIRAACCGLPIISGDAPYKTPVPDYLTYKVTSAPVIGINEELYRIDQMWSKPDMGSYIHNLRTSLGIYHNKTAYLKLKGDTEKQYRDYYNGTDLIEVCEALHEQIQTKQSNK